MPHTTTQKDLRRPDFVQCVGSTDVLRHTNGKKKTMNFLSKYPADDDTNVCLGKVYSKVTSILPNLDH